MDIAYLTDIEGQWEKLETFCADNPLVSLAGEQLVVAEGARFVFGGDAIDRGPFGRRIVECFTQAKQRYGERVVLLAGNRDINKLRLGRELRGQLHPRAPESLRDADRASVLGWVFSKTMGAGDALEHRKRELVAVLGRTVSDEEVAESFLEDVAPGGALTRYLALCQLGYREGCTLFVHGGVSEGSLGTVPAPSGPREVKDLDAWIAALNAWYDEQIAAYRDGVLDLARGVAWQPLIDYQAPVPGLGTNPQSVVYARLAAEHNDPRLPAAPVVERLGAAGIRRLVVGHMPTGDTPSVLRDPERDFTLILADNSHGRVNSASRVLVNDDEVRIAGEVLLDDGQRRPVRFRVAAGDTQSPIGLHAGPTGPLIKAPLDHGEYLMFRALPDYRIAQWSEPATWSAKTLCVPYARGAGTPAK